MIISKTSIISKSNRAANTIIVRPTLMRTKNLNANGPNPFFGGGGTKNMVRVNLMANGNGFVLAWFRQQVQACLCGGETKMKLSNGNDHLFFKTRG